MTNKLLMRFTLALLAGGALLFFHLHRTPFPQLENWDYVFYIGGILSCCLGYVGSQQLIKRGDKLVGYSAALASAALGASVVIDKRGTAMWPLVLAAIIQLSVAMYAAVRSKRETLPGTSDKF